VAIHLMQGPADSEPRDPSELSEAQEGSAAMKVMRASYDVVVANYFLNLFDVDRAGRMMRILAERVRPDGLLICADFARPAGGRLGRWITQAHYRPANWVAWALGFCDLHPILDYPRLLEPLGFRIRHEQRFPVWLGQNPAYMMVVAERVL